MRQVPEQSLPGPRAEVGTRTLAWEFSLKGNDLPPNGTVNHQLLFNKFSSFNLTQ